MSEVKPKKALGQHFLVDLNIARKICDALSTGTASPAPNPAGESAPGTGRGLSVSTDPSATPPSAPADRRPKEAADHPAPAPQTHKTSSTNTQATAERPADPTAAPGRILFYSKPNHDASAVKTPCPTDLIRKILRESAHPKPGDLPALLEKALSEPAPQSSDAPCDVLEVGCGMGVLTRFLLERKDITLYGAEIDPESVAYLHAHYPAFAPRLIEGDFLRMDLRAQFPRGVRIIGNFPYNISSQIFFKVLEHRDLIPECVGMIQREVAVRLAEGPGSKEYGILSVLLQAWYDIEYLFTVGEKVFNPPPKVKSAVVRLRRNRVERLDCDEKLFVRVVKASFGQRRKMLRNSLKAVFGDFGGAEHPFFSRRAEQLSVPDFVQLTQWVAVRLAEENR